MRECGWVYECVFVYVVSEATLDRGAGAGHIEKSYQYIRNWNICLMINLHGRV